MRVLIAPDSFGGTLTASGAADAIAVGWRRRRPGDVLVFAPQSDGGPGFVDVLAAGGGHVHTATVPGPLDTSVDARWLRRGTVAYVESAQACGLHLLGREPDPSTAAAAHSAGVGALVAAAVAAGAGTVVVGLGGSSCTDGGRGLVAVLGADADRTGLDRASGRLSGVRLIAATDVDNPLLGPSGAAAVFGPQKGADPATVALLERRNTDWAAVLDGFARGPVSTRPGAGAAGGLGAALLALGGERRSGAEVVAELTGQDRRIADTDLVITGEGRFDRQSLGGKAAVAVARSAHRNGVPVLVLAGQVDLDPDDPDVAELGLAGVFAVAEHAGSVQAATSDAARHLAALAEFVAGRSGDGIDDVVRLTSGM